MTTRPMPLRCVGQLRRIVPRIVAASLSLILVLPAALHAATPHGAPRSAPARKHTVPPLTPTQRSLHALNRLTFGPRPGELAEVQQIGLEAWFQQQLDPERIPDDALALRLAQYPAMQLSQAQLVARFPTPGMLRRYTKSDLALPQDDVEHAIYADGIFRYESKIEEKQTAKQAQAAAVALTPTAPDAAPVVRVPPGAQSPTPVGAQKDSPATLKDAVLRLPPAARMQRLVSLSPEEMQNFQDALKGPDQERLLAGLSPEQMEQVAAMRSPERLVVSEVLSTRLLRDVYSQRQLQAVMTDFWLNHFSVYLHKNQNEPYLLPAYERDAVLPNALGRFEDLLVATARSPAMLLYLDNAESIGPNSKAALRFTNAQVRQPEPSAPKAKVPKGINENYARELMELHTLGVKGGYTQADIIEVAKCFTGWTIDRSDEGGGFVFNANRHEPGPKTVLGHVLPESGMNEGLEVLHTLATSRATAQFVSEKLAQRFVSDTPHPALVNRMAATFLKSDGNIKAVLTVMFHSPEFWAPDVYRAKVKTPLEFAASALRATDADVANPTPLVQAVDRLGMPIYGMQTPNGYSWQADAWVSSNALLTRMNFALVLGGNRLQGTRLSWLEFLGIGTAATSSPDPGTERRLELALLGQPATAQTHDAALNMATTPGVQVQAEQSFRATPVHSTEAVMPLEGAGVGLMMKTKAGRNANAASPPTTPETPLTTMAGLLLGSPDFQRR